MTCYHLPRRVSCSRYTWYWTYKTVTFTTHSITCTVVSNMSSVLTSCTMYIYNTTLLIGNKSAGTVQNGSFLYTAGLLIWIKTIYIGIQVCTISLTRIRMLPRLKNQLLKLYRQLKTWNTNLVFMEDVLTFFTFLPECSVSTNSRIQFLLLPTSTK